jgi:hypothetical protein
MAPRLRSRIARRVAVLIVGAAVLRVAVIPPEICPPVTSQQVRVAIDETLGWFERGIGPDGRLTYAYDREHDVVDPSYSHARHAGVVMSLYQAHEALGSERALALGDLTAGFALRSLFVHDDGWVAWHPGGDIEVGPNGLLVAGLAVRRAATGDPTHDGVIEGIGRFLLGQQQPDGSVDAVWRPSIAASVPVREIFATGQASWALALLDRVFPGDEWARASARTLDYLAHERDRVEGEIARYPDHWAAYTIAALPSEMRSDERLGYARRLAGYFGLRIRVESQRTGEGLNLVVRWHPGPPAGVGTALEGIGMLHAVSVTDPRMADLRANIEERMVCAAGLMVHRQETEATAAGWGRPELVRGAWFYRGRTQMDDQQHVLSGLLMVLPVLEAREAGR